VYVPTLLDIFHVTFHDASLKNDSSSFFSWTPD
jgi:hypothetical protein